MQKKSWQEPLWKLVGPHFQSPCALNLTLLKVTALKLDIAQSARWHSHCIWQLWRIQALWWQPDHPNSDIGLFITLWEPKVKHTMAIMSAWNIVDWTAKVFQRFVVIGTPHVLVYAWSTRVPDEPCWRKRGWSDYPLTDSVMQRPHRTVWLRLSFSA